VLEDCSDKVRSEMDLDDSKSTQSQNAIATHHTSPNIFFQKTVARVAVGGGPPSVGGVETDAPQSETPTRAKMNHLGKMRAGVEQPDTDMIAATPGAAETDAKDKENSNASQQSQLSWKHYIEQEPDAAVNGLRRINSLSQESFLEQEVSGAASSLLDGDSHSAP
jgi:hypothetical protein